MYTILSMMRFTNGLNRLENIFLTESVNDHIRDYTNETVLGKAKYETTYLPIVDFIALTLKCYSCINLTLDDVEKKRTLKGVSKVVVKSTFQKKERLLYKYHVDQ